MEQELDAPKVMSKDQTRQLQSRFVSKVMAYISIPESYWRPFIIFVTSDIVGDLSAAIDDSIKL